LWCKGINLESKVSPPAKYFTPFALENSTAGERKGRKKKPHRVAGTASNSIAYEIFFK